jgi:hypothetical protein
MKPLAILMSPSAFGCGSNLRFLKTQETTNIYSLSISPIFEAAFFPQPLERENSATQWHPISLAAGLFSLGESTHLLICAKRQAQQ